MDQFYEAKNKEAYMKTLKNDSNASWLFNNTFKYESKLSKDLFDFSREELLQFLADRNSKLNTLNVLKSTVSSYIRWANEKGLTKRSRNVAREISKADLKTVAKNEESNSNVLHYEKVYELVGKKEEVESPLKNMQDRLLVYLIFLGVGGDRLKEIINLKEHHIDKETNLIKLSMLDSNRKDLQIDDFGIMLIEKTLKEKYYDRYLDERTDDSYDYKWILAGNDEGYIFRRSETSTPTGTAKLTYQSILKRLTTISKYIGLKLNVTQIKKSGMLYFAKVLSDNGFEIARKEELVHYNIFDRYDITKEHAQFTLTKELRGLLEEVY